MRPVELYAALLGISAAVDEIELRKAYRRLARENHPDRFEPRLREEQSRRMAEINEAYRAWLRLLRGGGSVLPPAGSAARPAPAARGATAPTAPAAETRALAELRDPAYAYYKQGFVHFSRGAGGMMFRGRSRRILPDENGLRRVLDSLAAFVQAQGYFRRLIEEFPDSIWTADAEWKLVRIRGFLRVYESIRGNLERRLRENQEQQ
ncbi:MAG: DnaJ domain-containing protein [Leptospirales bacterium]|nr:DnaJ domain-containing protein [Leptospirales bacterium]